MVPAALLDLLLALRTLFELNCSAFIVRVHPFVHSSHFKDMPAVNLNKTGTRVVFKPEQNVESLMSRVTDSTNFDTFVSAQANAGVTTIKYLIASFITWFPIAGLVTLLSADAVLASALARLCACLADIFALFLAFRVRALGLTRFFAGRTLIGAVLLANVPTEESPAAFLFANSMEDVIVADSTLVGTLVPTF